MSKGKKPRPIAKIIKKDRPSYPLKKKDEEKSCKSKCKK